MKTFFNLILLLSILSIIIYFSEICKSNLKTYKQFVQSSICKRLINSATHFKQSRTISGNTKTINSNRTSSSMFYYDGENTDVDNLKLKVSKLLNVKLSHFEPAQITKYDKNQEYKYHYDYFNTNIGSQRRYTALMYLNSVPIKNGGQTKFYLGDSVQPECGKLIVWENTNENGMKMHKTLHCGKPIKGDFQKYIITFWTRHDPIN